MNALQPHITGFSVTFQLEGKPGQEIICGGKVTKIVDMSQWGDENEQGWLIYVTLDDGAGEMLIVVPGLLWEEVDAEVGDVVIASGILFSLPKTCQFKSKADTDILVVRADDPLRLLVRTIRKLPKE
ncbi:DNA-binding protein (plasmid) [Cytobacillus oceanisediminis]|nr:DNA-binding protein [Cytobacillus oceanisediminis]